VIGIAKDTKYRSLLSEPPLLLYLPVSQDYDGRTTLIVRSADPARLLPAIRAEIAGLDKNLPVFGVETMPEHIAASLWEQRMAAGLIGMFGLLALVLAAAGLYGVVAYSVSQRTREIGIRMALGARRNDILQLVLGQGLRLAMIGVLAGLGVALGATPLMSGLLYGVSPTDPLTFAAISLLLVGIALAASWLPARRAIRVDPTIALRYE
jgi:putative ABC transport system permease protein